MVADTTTPTQIQGYMISSSDINDNDTEDSTPLNTSAANPRGIYDTAYESGKLRSDSTTTLPSPPSSPDMDELEREAIEQRDRAFKTNNEAHVSWPNHGTPTSLSRAFPQPTTVSGPYGTSATMSKGL